MYTEYLYKDSLAHHGIKGQRWGVRRFQNPDGTLTPEGKARYSATSPKKQLSNGDYLYKKGTIVGRFGSDNNWDKNSDITYLFTNKKDREFYSNRIGGDELIYKFTKDVKMPSLSKQYSDLLDFVKHDKSINDQYEYAKEDPFNFWKDNINQGGYVADRYYSSMKSKGYDALIDFRNFGMSEDPIIIISPNECIKQMHRDKH